MRICPKCGLPLEACICKELEKEKEKITISSVKRSYGKIVTVIEGIKADTKEIAKKLKKQLACGGTVKENVIELQGDHKKKAKEILVKLGFREENISIV
ncbi:stress response translation initiation inhibitor YciH [Candidatus Pacearchaeota archaeon ex4484_31]|nr:MAG: stress response translation initiation inhibitor YciH [Candidatus Pacearchaeota archaeon ex4484_31]